MSIELIGMLAEDAGLIPYRRSLREITGSVTSAILLQQIVFRAKSNDWNPFYKFKEPCAHELYRDGDSWTEELGFGRREFDTALKPISTKIRGGVSKEDILRGETVDCLVLYWTDNSRMTYYMVNRDLLGKVLTALYQKRGSYFTKSADRTLPITENTTEKTIEENNSSPTADAPPETPSVKEDEKPAKKTKKAKGPYLNEETGVTSTSIAEAYKQCIDYAEPGLDPKGAATNVAAKKLAESGWYPHQVITAFWILKQGDFFKNKHLPLASIVKQIAALNAKLVVPEEYKNNGSQSGSTKPAAHSGAAGPAAQLTMEERRRGSPNAGRF